MAPVNGIYVLQGVVPAEIAAAPVRVKVVETYDDFGSLRSAADVAVMKGRGGVVLGYFSLGEAETIRPYWSTLPSSMVGPEDPAWPGDYEVAFWTPQWLAIARNAIQTMIAQGYNGAYFDVVDEAFTDWAQQNAPNHDPQGAMVALIQQLAAFARTKNANFQIWINASGAEPILADASLIKTINGVYEENLFYESETTPQDPATVSDNLARLRAVAGAGKPVVAIEYVSGAAQIASVTAQAKANGLGVYIANPDLALRGVDIQGFAPPSVTISSAGGTTAAAVQTLSGTVDAADAFSTVTLFDGKTKIGSTTVAASGAWSARVKLTNLGANVITATDSNDAGTGTSRAVTFTLKETPPTVTISGAGGTTAAAMQTIAGTVDVADAYSTVTLFDGKTKIGSATVAANGAWSAGVKLTNLGANVITATDTNYAGTGTSKAVTYTLAQTPPTVTIAGAGGSTAAAAQTISGAVDVADAYATVTLFDGKTKIGTATANANGAWSARITLAMGVNVLTATVANYAGTGTSNAVTYTLGKPPTVTIASPGGATASAAQTIAGAVDVADAGTTVTIHDGAATVASAKVGANGAWSATVTLTMGANTLTATDANAFGAGTSNAVVYTLGAPPTVTVANPVLSVVGGGGTVALGVRMTTPAAATATTVTIAGLPAYETITDALDKKTFAGSAITLTSAQVASGLTLRSTYTGSASPSATLTITSSATIAGVAFVSPPTTLVVNDPPPGAAAAPLSLSARDLLGSDWRGVAAAPDAFAPHHGRFDGTSRGWDSLSLLAYDGNGAFERESWDGGLDLGRRPDSTVSAALASER